MNPAYFVKRVVLFRLIVRSETRPGRLKLHFILSQGHDDWEGEVGHINMEKVTRLGGFETV